MGNQWGRGGTGFPHASFNSFGGPQAPFGGALRAPAASPRGSPGSLAGGDVAPRGERARRDAGGGRLCEGESTRGGGASEGGRQQPHACS